MAVSYPFDLIRTPLAVSNFNSSFSFSDFDGTNKFEVVISPDCPDNVEDCINSSGVLKSGFTTQVLGDFRLGKTEEDNSIVISVANDVEYTINNDVSIKGVFIRKKSNNFIILYSINLKPIRFCEKIIFEKNTSLYTING